MKKKWQSVRLKVIQIFSFALLRNLVLPIRTTIGNTRVSVAYYSFYDNIQLYGMKVTAMEYNLWSYQ